MDIENLSMVNDISKVSDEELKRFKCLSPLADKYLHDEAKKNFKFRKAVTFLFKNKLDNEIVAFISFRVGSNDIQNEGEEISLRYFFVEYFAISKKFKGQKLGKKIFEAYIEMFKIHAEETNLFNSILLTPIEQKKVFKFYEDMGFKEIKIPDPENLVFYYYSLTPIQ